MALILNAVSRQDKKSNVLRAEGLIPAEFYGPDVKNESIAVNYNEFMKIYEKAGKTTLVDLKMPEGKMHSVLIGALQVEPRTDRISHADLRQVSLTKKMEAAIEIKFVGIAPAVNAGGVFIANRSALTVMALPKDLVSEIEVDISSLANIDDKIMIGDIKLPAGVEPVEDASVAVASIARQVVEEVATPATADAEKAAIEAVAVEKKGKEEKEEDKE